MLLLRWPRYAANSGKHTLWVKESNAWGLYDVQETSEWVSDFYNANYTAIAGCQSSRTRDGALVQGGPGRGG